MIYDAEKFVKRDRSYSIEASDLGLQAGQSLSSFTLTNCPSEGQHRTFQRTEILEDEGDIKGWRYEEMKGGNYGRDFDYNPYKKVEPLRVTIFND